MKSRQHWSLPVAGTTLAAAATTNALEAISGAGVGPHRDVCEGDTAGQADIVCATPGRHYPCEKRAW